MSQTKIEIVVTEDDLEGEKIVGLVKEIGAFALVLGLHDHSFIYRYVSLFFSPFNQLFTNQTCVPLIEFSLVVFQL